MTLDTAACLVALVLVLIIPTYLLLEVRAVRKALRQLHQAHRKHAGAIIQLQTTVANTPLQVHAPMATVTKVTATISGDRSLQPHTTNDRPTRAPGGWAKSELWGKENGPELFQPSHALRAALAEEPELKGKAIDPDQTLRLGPPPSLARIGELCHAAGLNPPRESLARIAAIEQHLAGGRPTTRMELARALNLQPWEISADLHTAILARIVTTTSGHHTAGEAAYTLPDPTIRMARMPLLPGAA